MFDPHSRCGVLNNFLIPPFEQNWSSLVSLWLLKNPVPLLITCGLTRIFLSHSLLLDLPGLRSSSRDCTFLCFLFSRAPSCLGRTGFIDIFSFRFLTGILYCSVPALGSLCLLVLRLLGICSVIIPSSTFPSSSPFVFFHFFCVFCWVAQLSVAQVGC